MSDHDAPPDFDDPPAPPDTELTRIRLNLKLSESWAEAVRAHNESTRAGYIFPSPADVTPRLMELREMPAMPWPQAWPQMARRCRTYPGDVVGVVGSIGGGKTSFAIQMGLAASAAGLPVLWAPLELGQEQVLTRIVGNMHGVHAATVRDHWTRQQIDATAASFSDMWRFIDRLPAGASVEAKLRAIEVAIELAVKIYRRPPVTVLDHLHKLIASERDETQALRMVMDALEGIAQRTMSFVVALAQSSVSNQKVLTGRVEQPSASDMLALESGGKAVADGASNSIVLVVYKEDDSMQLDAQAAISKSRHGGGEGRVGMRFFKPGGVWRELDYLPATPSAVAADIEAKRKDRHRAAPPPSPIEARRELNSMRELDAAGMRRLAIREALARHGMLGMELTEIRRVPGAGRGSAVMQALQELERAGDAERSNGRWRMTPRYGT